MSSGGGDVPDVVTTITRYATYVEEAHQAMMWTAYNYREYLWDLTPFAALSVANPTDAFFMAGHVIEDYPTVYDMYGKFMAGLDVEVLWNQIHTDAAYGLVINEAHNADSDIMEDELDEQIAELFAQAQTINAVMSSSFLIAEANMRSKKIYAMAKHLADLRIRFSELAQRRWEAHLDWNSRTTEVFLKVNELFFNLQTRYLQDKATIDTSNLLWPFTLLDHERSIVACMQGAMTSETKGLKGGGSGWSTAANIAGTAASIVSIVGVAI